MKRDRNHFISGNAKVVRNVNRAVVLNIIREMQPISRVKISKLAGLNKSTVSSIVADLVEEGLIYQEEEPDRNVGRNPINLRLKLGEHLVGAVNIDTAETRLAIADINGSLLASATIDTDPRDPERFVRRCVEQIFGLRDRLKIRHLKGIGVSIAGIVDHASAKITTAPRLGWEDFEIGKVLKGICPESCLIVIDNDAKSSALAELWFGKHDRSLMNFVFLSIGSGIGTGIVVEKKLVDGAFHAAGEFGHMTIFEGGELCSCGNHGCWEAYASDPATVRRYRVRTGKDLHTSVDVALQEIISLANEGEPDAREVLLQTGYYLGLGIANIVKTIDPEAIIIGGGITQSFDLIYPEIMRTVARRASFGVRRDVKIFPTSLSVGPRLLGAATLAIKEIFDGFKITR